MRAFRIILTAVGVLALLAFDARAECILPGKWWLDDKAVTGVFSGTVTKQERTAPSAYRVTVAVDQVWKGDIPRAFVIYVWEQRSTSPQLAEGSRYLLAVRHMQGRDEREGAGLDPKDERVLYHAPCGGFDYEHAVRLGSVAQLGAARRIEH